MLLKRRMSNEERGTENEERTREPESFHISILRFRQSFPVPITISTFPVPRTSLEHPSRFNGWS